MSVIKRKYICKKDEEERFGLTQSELKALLHALDQSLLVAIFDREGVYQYVNSKFCEVSQYGKRELLGKDQSILDSGCHSKKFLEKMWRTIISGNTWKGELRNRRKGGSFFWVGTTITPFLNGRKPDQYLMIQTDITKYKMAEERARYLTQYDPLTGIPNRTQFNDFLTHALAEAEKHQQSMAILVLDLDRFKMTNDRLGHTIGDQVLEMVAGRLRKCLREIDLVARMGGDEFAILLPDISKDQDLILLTERIFNTLEHPFQIESHEIMIKGSFGISSYPNDGEDAETLLKNAELAMYDAKKEGKGRARFYVPQLHKRLHQTLKIETALSHAIELEELELYYQPLVSLRTGEIVGMEALLRWDRPGIGLISPEEFIPIAEETGLILPIGEWVLKTACEQNRVWQGNGHVALTIAVNVSSLQFEQEDFVEMVALVIKETCLEAHSLKLEMTESLFLKNTERIIERLHRLKDMGLKLSIDDFGTGYSSLGYLKRFPIDSLKIDRSFINGIAENEDDAVLAKTIIALAHNLRLDVIAEGIETEEQLIFLQEHQCDIGQGYLFSRPVPSENAGTLLTKKSYRRKETKYW